MSAWLFFALTAPFLFSASQIFDKLLREKHLGTFTLSIFVGLASFWVLALVPFVDLAAVFSSPLVVIAGLAAGALFFLNAFPYFEAMSVDEASRVIPLWALEAPMVLIFAFVFLKERLLIANYIGFAAVVSGAFLVSAKKVKDVFKPSKAFLLMLLATFFTATAVIIVKWLYSQLSFWPIQLLSGIGGGTAALLVAFLFSGKKGPSSFREILRLKKKTFLLLGLREIAVNGGFLLYGLAIMTGSVSLSVALSQLNALYMLIMATFISTFRPGILLEVINRKTLLIKAAAIFLIILGVFAINV